LTVKGNPTGLVCKTLWRRWGGKRMDEREMDGWPASSFQHDQESMRAKMMAVKKEEKALRLNLSMR